MLAEMLTTSLRSLNLSIRDHAALAAGQESVYAEVFERDGHCCHICGSRCLGAMEIDHVKGHRTSKAANLKTICQFCHVLEHPLWGGARKKFIPILAGDFTQADLNRLAWVLLAWRDAPDSDVPVSRTIDMIEYRRAKFEDAFGCATSEALFEAAFSASEQSALGMSKAIETLRLVDQSVRFWPSELIPEYADLPPAARLSRWDIGGFQLIADETAKAIRSDLNPDMDRIRELMSQLSEN